MPILNREAFSCWTMATQSKLYGYSDCFGRLLIFLKAGRELALQTIQQNPIIYLWRHQTWAPSCNCLASNVVPLNCFVFFEITSCSIFQIEANEGTNNKEGLCMSTGAMCAFCRNCLEIVNSRMKSNNKLTIRVNFSCVCRMPDVLHVMLKPVSGVIDFNKKDFVMLDLSSGSPDPEALSCIFEE